MSAVRQAPLENARSTPHISVKVPAQACVFGDLRHAMRFGHVAERRDEYRVDALLQVPLVDINDPFTMGTTMARIHVLPEHVANKIAAGGRSA